MAITSRDDDTHHPVLNETRARQGRFGRHVFWVLAISTALASVGLFSAWMFKAGDLASTTPTSQVTPAEASTFDAPEPAPATR
jgi:hypothetical protein